MSCFPFLVNVDRLKGIIIGGGKVATEKVHRLIEFEPDLTVIAPSVSDEILKYQNQITVKERQYVASDLDGADYVIAATGDRNINEKIYRDAKSRHILINVVDMPELCDFIFEGSSLSHISTQFAPSRVTFPSISTLTPGAFCNASLVVPFCIAGSSSTLYIVLSPSIE